MDVMHYDIDSGYKQQDGDLPDLWSLYLSPFFLLEIIFFFFCSYNKFIKHI